MSISQWFFVVFNFQTMLFTIGYSNRSFKHLLRRIKKYQITRVIDIRDYPYSKRFPHFSQENLQPALATENIKYQYLGNILGSCPYSETNMYEFNEKISEIIIQSETENLVLLCSTGLPYPTEYNPSGCHRWWKISQYIQRYCPQRKIFHILLDSTIRSSYDLDYYNHNIDFNGNVWRN